MTLPETPNWLLPDDGHPSLEQLRLYHEEILPAAARHQVEKHVLNCELCADVLAGMGVSNRSQTHDAVTDLQHRLHNRVQPDSQKKTRPLYAPMLQVAAALVLLLLGASLFRYLKQPVVTLRPEKEQIAQTQPEPTLTTSAPPDPIIKPAEPKAQVSPHPKVTKATQVARTEATKPALTTPAPDDELFAVDSAVILDAFALKTAETTATALASPLPPQTGGIAAESVKVQGVVTSSVANKQMGVSMRKASTFTGQTVAGKVTDAAGQPLPGVTVLVKGTTTGVATDAAGNFLVNVPNNNNVLSFSFIGYETQEQKINPENNLLAIKLEPNTASLNEVVAVGYGESKNISIEVERAKPTIGRKAFNKYIRNNLRYPADAQQQLQGQVEVGFTVTETGALINFKILKSLSPTCDAEAIRVIKEGPAWQPRRFQQQSQSEEVRITVRFKAK